MSEKLRLQWNDFEENIKVAFGNLREDNDFADVSLVSEDGQQVEAHKAILAASSPFFKKILGRNKHPHPLIYLRGVKSEDVVAIVDFLYLGEASVFQENLDSFLTIAEEFQLKDLTMGEMDEKGSNEKYLTTTSSPFNNTNLKIANKSSKKQIFNSSDPEENRTVSIPGKISGDFQELEEKVQSMMEKSENTLSYKPNTKASLCKVCGKEGASNVIKGHIEANHLAGIILPCTDCHKTFRSGNALMHHNR